MSLGFVFSPGWSFGPEFFKPLAACLKDYRHVYLQDISKKDTNSYLLDRHATPLMTQSNSSLRGAQRRGNPDILEDNQHQPDLSKGVWIGIGHSLGFSRLLSLPLQGLVSISGFVRFCAHNPTQTGTALRIMDRMIAKFEIDPKAVLEDFYKKSAYEIHEHRRSDVGRTDILKNEGYMENPLTDPFIRFNKRQLLDDLEFMKKMDFTSELRAFNAPVLSLAAKDDQIVPFALTKETFESSIALEKGGHGMGYTHADWCAKKIKNWITNDLNF
ncbi:MAG: alpha/beta hydrolase [Alphaproteobacteria bacterium]|nr:alpha/beta hydrolase [Alphaproteobacteria bacterium]